MATILVGFSVHCGNGRSSLGPCRAQCLDDPEFCEMLLNVAADVDPSAACPQVCDKLWSLRGIEFRSNEKGQCYYLIADSLEDYPLRMVSTVPAARTESGELVPVCLDEGEVDGVLLSFAILKTSFWVDPDLGLRPGDIVKTLGKQDMVLVTEEATVGPNRFLVDISCVEPYPDPDIGTTKECQGFEPSPTETGTHPESVRYISDLPPDSDGLYTSTRDLSTSGVGVAILIDQSGSMKGWVDPESKADVTMGLGSAFPSDGYASDILSARIGAVAYFLRHLNPADKAIVFQYGEGTGIRARVVCYDGLGDTPEEALREQCYGTDRNRVLGEHTVQNVTFPPELDRLQSFPEHAARSPLWAAVADVYDFMMARKDTETRHILVINDGPDTCAASSPDYRPFIGTNFQGICSAVGYEEFRSRVLEDRKDPNLPRVHIHFIQFQAYGYLERDLRQQEMACLTGGSFQFINSLKPVSLLDEQTGIPFEQALFEAVMRVRYSLVGVWQMALNLPNLPMTLPRGAEYSLTGRITLVGADRTLTALDQFLYLGVGDPTLSSLASLDRRAAFRLPCSSPSECAWFQGPAPECRDTACLSVDSVCGLQPLPDGRTCGFHGVCCRGWCAEGKTECLP